MQDLITEVTCSFCGKTVSSTGSHDCAEKIFTLVNTMAQERNPENIFNNLDNLVFQGGGVKGVSYFGVLQRLKEEKSDLLNNIKRVAGTSAGSLVALYLALNMDLDVEIKPVLELDFTTLLEDGLLLNIHVNPLALLPKKIQRTVKSIVLAGVDKFDKISQKMDDPMRHDEIINELATLFERFIINYGCHKGLSIKLILEATQYFIKDALKWLLEFFIPDTHSQPNLTTNIISKMNQMGQDSSSNGRKDFSLIFDKAFEQAVQRLKDSPVYNFEENDLNKAQKREKDNLNFYVAQRNNNYAGSYNQIDTFTDDELDYSLAELLWTILQNQTDKEWQTEGVGLFPGLILKELLIDSPIRNKLRDLGFEDSNPTFYQFSQFQNKQGNYCFKDLYVTAFNIGTLRTEVFSAKHTPNVLVSDAIRASISIPIFFEPFPITENGQLRQVNSSVEQNETVYYMDGGVFDNYPIWIFDDLEFCLQDTLQAKWIPKYRLSIQNPKTLGFRILDSSTISKYVRPYTDDKRCLIPKQIKASNNENTFSFIIDTLLKAEMTQHEESCYINEGNCPRTAYIDNLGLSAISFNLSRDQKDALKISGRQSVEDYIKRAKETHFVGEGQRYP